MKAHEADPDGAGAATVERAVAAVVSIIEVATARLPTRHGTFTVHAMRDAAGTEHLALTRGEPFTRDPVLTRVHSECLTGDVLGSVRCDCGAQLDLALSRIAEARCGILLYLRGHEGRGIGLLAKIAAYGLQDEGLDTVDANRVLGFAADLRSYEVAAGMLAHLGVASVRLLTNNPEKVRALRESGISVVEQLAHSTGVVHENLAYLRAKRDRLGHLLPLLGRA